MQKAMREGRIARPLKKSARRWRANQHPKRGGASACAGSVTSRNKATADGQHQEQARGSRCAPPMGRSATATMERLAASLGRLDEAAPRFAAALDIARAAYCWLCRRSCSAGSCARRQVFSPAVRLCRAQNYLSASGLYGAGSALVGRGAALLRAGRMGKLFGLDRAPEVRTLRIKLKHLADQEQAFSWSSTLCKESMHEAPEEPPFFTSTPMSASTTAPPKHCPSTMWLASACASVQPSTIGSTPWTANPAPS